MKKSVGFIGQGWIGKHYADDFEKRGYEVIRYGLEKLYINNKEKIKDCDIVFIAVPTPSTPKGFDDSIVRESVKLVGKGKIAVIKSTLLVGITESIQEENPNIYVMHSPEFLREAHATYDVANPERNIIGLSLMHDDYKDRANLVMEILPKAPYELICSSREAELIKYAGNCFLYTKVVFMNMLYDLSEKLGARWDKVKEGMIHDSRIGKSHTDIIHKNGGSQSGRGAGGHCFIKDFTALAERYEDLNDKYGNELLKAFQNKNIKLLLDSNKDVNLLEGVYGKEFLDNFRK